MIDRLLARFIVFTVVFGVLVGIAALLNLL